MKKILITMAFLATATSWAYQNTMLNLTAVGGRMTGTRFTNIGSIVPVGGTTTRSSRFCNYSGFAAGFALQPNRAFSGLADEWNPDNDRDRLRDDEEIVAGSNLWKTDTDEDGLSDFDEVKTHGSHPARSDSDFDGMTDDLELIAGTGLTNSSSLLAIRCDLQPNGGRVLSWHGVSDRLYTFEYTSTLNTNAWMIFPFDVPGRDEEISFLDEAGIPSRFYRVKVRKP